MRKTVAPKKASTPAGVDQITVALEVAARAGQVFGDAEKAIDWLNWRNPALRNHTPLETLTLPHGRQDIENLLGQIESGIFA
jgi:uncharacterized protein (DUF2384 family)